MQGLERFIATVETSKHRFFVFLENEILPDNRLVAFALSDAYFLGILSSVIHTTWALRAGGTLEDRPVYNKTRCFDPFPFPVCSEVQKAAIRAHAEELDAHRKRQQELFPDLKMTDMYNVLVKLRAGEPLEEREQEVYEEGLIAVLKEIHDKLDIAVADAYDWPANLTSDEILQRIVALNAERAREEQNGTIRWLRPEYQQPQAVAVQTVWALPRNKRQRLSALRNWLARPFGAGATRQRFPAGKPDARRGRSRGSLYSGAPDARTGNSGNARRSWSNPCVNDRYVI